MFPFLSCLRYRRLNIQIGGSSGIGFSAGRIFTSHGAKVFLLDRNAPTNELPAGAKFIACDITRWRDILDAFDEAGAVDIAVANAGVSEEADYFQDTFDSDGALIEPKYGALDVNLRGTLKFIKVAISNMKRNKTEGSIVLTTSATAYSPEQSLPVYSSSKLAVSFDHQTLVLLKLSPHQARW